MEIYPSRTLEDNLNIRKNNILESIDWDDWYGEFLRNHFVVAEFPILDQSLINFMEAKLRSLFQEYLKQDSGVGLNENEMNVVLNDEGVRRYINELRWELAEDFDAMMLARMMKRMISKVKRGILMIVAAAFVLKSCDANEVVGEIQYRVIKAEKSNIKND